MDTPIQQQYLYLSLCSPLSGRLLTKLLKELSTIQKIVKKATNDEFSEELNAKVSFLKNLDEQVNHCLNDSRIKQATEWAKHPNNHLVCYESSDYPPLLREIDDPPALLYVIGNKELLLTQQVAIVGSRKSSRYGKTIAFKLAEELSQLGLSLVSGMASGIDSQCHLGCLENGRPTIAVLGTGVDRCYPTFNKGLKQKIEESGALISEYPLGTPPMAYNFPKRNRIISGLSIGVIVVEAALRSGSLITCRMAMEQNREVFAVPGLITNPQATGCHKLISEGATIAQSSQQIIHELNLSRLDPAIISNAPAPNTEISPELSPLAVEIVASLQASPATLDQLFELKGCSLAALSAALLSLEVNKLIESEGGRYTYTGFGFNQKNISVREPMAGFSNHT